MSVSQILPIAQIVIAVFLIASILLQQRGSGLSSAFGGQGGGVYYQRRGLEKVLVILSVIFAIIWAALAVASLMGR